MDDSPITVDRCPAELRATAIRALYQGQLVEQQPALLQAIEHADTNEASWDGLLVAQQNGLLIAAVWIQQGAGNSATIWPPATQDIGARQLLVAASEYLAQHRVGLAQILLPPDESIDASLFVETGFPKLADLIYLFAEATKRSSKTTADVVQLEYEPRAGENFARLAAVLERTYVNSLDCPALDAGRPMDEVIESYRNQGRYDPDNWFFIRQNEQDIGALLLAEHAGSGNWELIYMGVAPEVRGQGLGKKIAQQALRFTCEGGGQRVVLAVDADNPPAIAAYRAAGFRQWDRRQVYGRIQQRR